MKNDHESSNAGASGPVELLQEHGERYKHTLELPTTMLVRTAESTGRYSLNPYRVEKENTRPEGIAMLMIPDVQRAGTLTDRYGWDSRETADKLSLTSSKPLHIHHTQRPSYYPQPTERLSITTLNSPNPPNPSTTLSLSKVTSILSDIWLMVFNTPFTSKNHCQVYQVCSAINQLQQTDSKHKQFIEQLKDVIGGEGMEFQELLERCREMVDCLMRMDGIKEEMQGKMEEYIHEIDALGRLAQELMEEREKLKEVGNMLEDRNRGLVEELARVRREYQANRLQDISNRLSFQENANLDKVDILEGENQKLRYLLENAEIQKSELLQTIEKDVAALKESIQQLVGEKIDLIRKLLEAENYIRLLRSSTESQTNQLKGFLQVERRISASLCKTPKAPIQIKFSSPMPTPPRNPASPNINQRLQQLLSDQTVQKQDILKRLFHCQNVIEQQNNRIANLEEYIKSLQQGLNLERHSKEQLQQQVFALRGQEQQQNQYTDNIFKKQKHQLLVFFQQLLGSLVVRCNQDPPNNLSQQIVHLIRIIQQKRQQDKDPTPVLLVTSPRTTPRSPYTRSPMPSPQMAYLKASKSVQKLALFSDEVCTFHSTVEKLFEQFKGYIHSFLLQQIMSFVKQLNLYPYHANLFALTERLIDNLKCFNIEPAEGFEKEAALRMGLEKMAVVFGEMEAKEARLPTVPEERLETAEMCSSQEGSQLTVRGRDEVGVQVNMDEIEYDKIQEIRGEIRHLQDQAEQLRQSLNYCLTETIESPKRVRKHIQVIDYQ